MKGIHRKRFRGRIASIDRPDLELDVELWIDERNLTVARHDKPLGIWPIENVSIDRVGSDRFVVTLGNEHSSFVARDPIAFSYEGVKSIFVAKEKAGKGFSRRFKRSEKGSPSLVAILVTRVQGLETAEDEPDPAHRRVDKKPPEAPPSPRVVADVMIDLEPADPYDSVDEIPAFEPDVPAPIQRPPSLRRHTGVLSRVKNARNGVVHEHVFTEHSASGGLLRRVCNECGHVSIDLNE